MCEGHVVGVFYPVLPWIGVIVLGYCFGKFYEIGFDQIKRKKYLLGIGVSSILLFILLRIINTYGDLVPWAYQKNSTLRFLSFMDVTKYPPSFMYLLITLGTAFIFLYTSEHLRNKVSQFFIVFGRVPLFYYFLHMLLIHLAAVLIFTIATDHKTNAFEAFSKAHLNGYGFSLPIVYVVWIVIVLLLYPCCNWYMKFKKKNKNSRILSYL